ncbi:MAG: NAD(+) synthase [Mycoplasma sp.]|nr:NAD(+) synthase [Candidatus Hennigella equi]
MQRANELKRLINKRRNQPKNLIKYGKYLSDFAVKSLHKTDANGYVVGISGGVDSALALAILATTPGIRVMGVFIDIESQRMDREDAKSLTSQFNFQYRYINLTKVYRTLVKQLRLGKRPTAKANLKARLRTIALYALAQEHNLLTVGTTNAAEKVVGYYTKFGDNACDLALLCNLTKSQIYYLAGEYNVPKDIIARKPSAGFYEGQTDEAELELTYKEIDHYLSFAAIDPLKETKINTKYIRNKHKLNAPIKPKKFMLLRNCK